VRKGHSGGTKMFKKLFGAKKDAFKALLQNRSSTDCNPRYTEARKAAALLKPSECCHMGKGIWPNRHIVLNCEFSATIKFIVAEKV